MESAKLERDYRIVSTCTNDVSKLQEQVQALLKMGYEPMGNVFIYTGSYGSHMIGQVMIRS